MLERRKDGRFRVLVEAFLEQASLDMRTLGTLWMDLDGVLTLDIVPGRPALRIQVVDLSATGLQALATVPVPEEGSPLAIRLFSRPEGRPVPLHGRVIWKKPEVGGSTRFGVRFEGIEEESAGRLERCLRQMKGTSARL